MIDDWAFYNIIHHQGPCWVVYEDDDVICFLPVEADAYGHTIIASKSQYADLFAAPPEVATGMMEAAHNVAKLYQKALGATGINLLQASGLSAQQAVPHLHMHLIPRFDHDGLNLWPKLKPRKYDREDFLNRLSKV